MTEPASLPGIILHHAGQYTQDRIRRRPWYARYWIGIALSLLAWVPVMVGAMWVMM